jgi:hypothetical protein
LRQDSVAVRGGESAKFRHCEERSGRGNPSCRIKKDWIASLRSQ